MQRVMDLAVLEIGTIVARESLMFTVTQAATQDKYAVLLIVLWFSGKFGDQTESTHTGSMLSAPRIIYWLADMHPSPQYIMSVRFCLQGCGTNDTQSVAARSKPSLVASRCIRAEWVRLDLGASEFYKVWHDVALLQNFPPAAPSK